MDAALVTSAALLGLAGTPHCAAMCAAMCAAPCASALRRARGLVRLGGALLAGASGWALSHDLWHRVAVWCGLA